VRRVVEPVQASFWNGQKTFAVVLGGVALAAGAVAVVEVLDYSAKKSDADAACPPAGCLSPANHAQAVSLLGEAQTASTAAIVSGAVAGAGAIAACVLWLTSGDKGSGGGGALRWIPTASEHDVGVRVAGAW